MMGPYKRWALDDPTPLPAPGVVTDRDKPRRSWVQEPSSKVYSASRACSGNLVARSRALSLGWRPKAVNQRTTRTCHSTIKLPIKADTIVQLSKALSRLLLMSPTRHLHHQLQPRTEFYFDLSLPNSNQSTRWPCPPMPSRRWYVPTQL